MDPEYSFGSKFAISPLLRNENAITETKHNFPNLRCQNGISAKIYEMQIACTTASVV
jgi:hypothetical protein